MFSYEFSEISKNIFFTEHLQATASVTKGLSQNFRDYLEFALKTSENLRSTQNGAFGDRG